MYTIKALATPDDEWVLEVLGNPYGGPHDGRDVDGEYFSQRTKFHADRFALPPVVYYHGMDETGRPAGSPQYIGRTVSREERADGVWYRVLLDKASEFARRVWEAAKRGAARASSGSAAHLVRRNEDGEIIEWPVVELSVFDADGQRQPANAYAVALPAAKALYTSAGLTLPTELESDTPTNAETPTETAEAKQAEAESAPADLSAADEVGDTADELRIVSLLVDLIDLED